MAPSFRPHGRNLLINVHNKKKRDPSQMVGMRTFLGTASNKY